MSRTDWKNWALSAVMAITMVLFSGAISSFDKRLTAAEEKVGQTQVDIATLQAMQQQLNRMEATLKEVKDELSKHMRKDSK